MRKFKFTILIAIWFIPLVFLCYWINNFKYGSRDLIDGGYIIKSGDLVLINHLSNGVFSSFKLINEKNNNELYLNGYDFSVKLGYKKDIGWIKKGKNQIQSTYSSKTIIPDNCKPIELIKTKDTTSFVFYCEMFKVVLQLNYVCSPKDKLIHRSLSLKSHNEQELVIEDVILGNWLISEPKTGGGKGLPVFVADKWFFSGEEPWDENAVKSNQLILTHHPSAFLKKDDIWTSDSFVIGGGCDDAKQILKDYITSVILPPRFFSLYNTWYDLRDNDLTTANITTNFISFTKKLNEFDASIDYCVIDDGWCDRESIYETVKKQYPNGLIEISKNIAPFNASLGLWVPYSGLYLDNEVLAKKGFEEANKKFFCLNGTNYFSALSNRLIRLIKDDNVAFFKHDFNFFVCTMPKHNHLRNDFHSEEVNMRQTTKLLNLERNTNQGVVQAITTGINLSPWWLKYAHILWMGGGDIDFDFKYPVTSRAEAEMTYRDGRLYEILKEKNIFFPLYAIMTHGIIDGKLNSVGPWLDDEQWSDYIMNYLGRGTAIRELYLYYAKLDKKKSEILAKGLNWAKAHNDYMLNSEMILGDPRKNEVYGFRGYDKKGNCYVSIRNPKFVDAEISLKDIGIKSEYYRIIYPHQRICEAEYLPKLKIPAESVIVIESLNKNKQANVSEYLIPRKVNTRQILIKDTGFSFDLDIPDNTTADLIITLNDKNTELKLADNDVPITQTKKISFIESKWKVEIVSFSRGVHKISGTSSKKITLNSDIKFQIRAKYQLTNSIINETYEID